MANAWAILAVLTRGLHCRQLPSFRDSENWSRSCLCDQERGREVRRQISRGDCAASRNGPSLDANANDITAAPGRATPNGRCAAVICCRTHAWPRSVPAAHVALHAYVWPRARCTSAHRRATEDRVYDSEPLNIWAKASHQTSE